MTMIHLNRLLFPTDGSDCAERAREHAAYLATRFDAAMHVVQVEERDVDLTDAIDFREADVLADLHAADSETSAARVEERRIAHPSVPDGILSYAEEQDVDLVVLGTHGRRGVQRVMMGSVAEEVVRRATCPVVTVGPSARPPDEMGGGRLLVPIDFSEFQDRLLKHALGVARAYDMTLILLHVVEVEGLPDVYQVYSTPPEPGVLADRIEQVLEQRADEIREQGVEVALEVRSGHAAEEILDTAAGLDADFLAIATHGRTGLDRILLGSVAETVIRQAPCPVLTVKAFGRSLVQEENGDGTQAPVL